MRLVLKTATALLLVAPLHQQPMAWAVRANVATVVQLPDNKPRLWLTRMAEKQP